MSWKKSNTRQGRFDHSSDLRRKTSRPRQKVMAGFRPYETFEAIFIGMSAGAGGFIRPIGMQKEDASDLFVDWRDSHGAVNGDKVLAELAESSIDGKLRGRVIRVLARTTAPIPAVLQVQPWGLQAVSLDPKMQRVIYVPPTDLAEEGDYITVVLDADLKSDQLRGTVVARLGKPADLKIENKLTATMFCLKTDFPTSVLDELAPFPTHIPKEWINGREDFRETITVTIDPPTAKDFDDAISLEVLPQNEGGGWLLGVHIADVSQYVVENGAVDQEAQLRGTSVYFPDECIPMLPDRLSGELCSLVEGVDRLTMTVSMTISPEIDIIETRVTESVIRSHRRLNYDQVKIACIDLDNRARHGLGANICSMLDQALVLSRRLREKRMGRGALDLDTEETEFIFADGHPIDAKRYERHDVHRMIEEFMLLANETVAKYFNRHKCPTIYRIHEDPDPLKMNVFKDLAVSLGLMRSTDQPTPELLNEILKEISECPLKTLINTMLLRSLKRAEYKVDNIGHSGLALDNYLHFTSPIRRYPDLVVHRILRRLLVKKEWPPSLYSYLTIIAKQAVECEQLATEAERENQRWKTCLLMKPKIGEKFQGSILGFSLKVAFVRLEAPYVEVGVPLGAIGSDFSVDEHRTKAIGNRGQVELPIGTKVRVEIASIDEQLHRVYAHILEADVQNTNGKIIKYIPSLIGRALLQEGGFVEQKRMRASRRITKTQGHQRNNKTREGDRKTKLPKGSVRGIRR
ncbi:MAG: VacB/RNase II family 3'-5' exoribonuclease [Holophagaceae bacterium]|nr:VacB/RNase II family 3'-5' exoribonuclease [Holophagaceae bacterium]